MVRSNDILTTDEKHLVVFAKGVTLDKSLPKYIIVLVSKLFCLLVLIALIVKNLNQL